ncbi:hypothetical protein BY458DRAFT_435591 [Sporodiniella umbellata]|nr:hypothetical protein BY458DRAFT_435591 [Sporodiniella umbellata]
MPSPSAYQPQLPANAWHQHQESSKTLDEPAYNNNNAYQYSGTPYGNPSVPTSAYSPQPNHIENTVNNNTSTFNAKPETQNSPSSGFEEIPSNRKALARLVIFILAVGHLGFSAGASPFSKDDVPFDSKICFYFLFAVVSRTLKPLL